MNFKSFFAFFYGFLGVISIITIPTLIGTKEYKKLVIFFLILSFLLIISVSLFVFFSKMAKGFDIESHHIRLCYYSSHKLLQITDIDRIFVTDYRYIFQMKSDKKHSVTRLVAPFKLEIRTDPRILDLAVNYGITLIINNHAYHLHDTGDGSL